jgi:site-specific recombinase XerD
MLSYGKNRDKVPSLTHHKASGQGVVRIDGKDVYCGPYGTPDCKVRYLRALAEWEAADRQPARDPAISPPPGSIPSRPVDLTVNEVLHAYLKYADGYYVKNGQPTSEPGNIRLAIKPLFEMFGDLPAAEFDPPRLKAVREAFIKGGLCRNEVNRRVRLIVRAFKWAVSEGMIPPSVHHGLKAVDGLRKGRSGVRESKPVKPVPDAFVDAILPHVSRQLGAMIQLQRLTGMRPGEACIMRTMDINTSGRIWEYRPESHKTEHHERDRVVFIGPEAQRILRPWLRPDLAAYLFQPREAVDEHRAERRRNRKTRVQPSQQDRRKRSPKRALGDHYNNRSYGHAVAEGCDKAFPHPVIAELSRKDLDAARRAELKAWCAANEAELRAWRKSHRWAPNQLRHNAATRLRREFGLDVAKTVLGHSSVVPTQLYAEQDAAKAVEAMAQIG